MHASCIHSGCCRGPCSLGSGRIRSVPMACPGNNCYVHIHVQCSFCGTHAVQDGFCDCKVSCFGGDLAGVFDHVTYHCHANSMWICLVWFVCADKIHVSGDASFQYSAVVNEKHMCLFLLHLLCALGTVCHMINYSHSRNPPCAAARTHGQIQAPREPPN
jgi:hypothetical protein